MKKIFTLSLLLTLAIGLSAQEGYRKSWNFTKWSATTVANLKAEATGGVSGGAWSDIEKATGTEPTELSKDNCFWEVTAQGNASEGATIQANGEPIAELEGLLYTNTTARSLAIAVNYQGPVGDDFGPYNGPSYLWLGSSNKNYFVIPHVAPGTVIKIGLESHKITDARGVQLFVGFGNSGTQLKDPDGNDVPAPTLYTDQEFLVPADAEPTNDDGTVDIQIRNTNGCHLYYITVGEGDEPQVEDAKKIAYLYSGDASQELAYAFIEGDQRFATTAIDVATNPTLDVLKAYDAVLVSSSIAADNAYVAQLKSIIAYVPVLNLSPAIYEPLALGKAVQTATNKLTITATGNDIFEGMDAETEYQDNITAVELGNYFAADDVLAKAGDAVAVHAHNAGRNAYYFVPEANGGEAIYTNLIPQTLLAAAKTKREVTAVSTPSISFTQQDGVSVVTISAANSSAIYYTLDGTDPTEASTLYTEPFTLTEAKTVKALATGDGFLNSQIGTKEVTIAGKTAAPAISVAREQGKTTVTITPGTEGAKVYFNYTGKNLTAADAQPYTAPIELTEEPTMVYAVSQADGMLLSDAVSAYAGIDGINAQTIRTDTIAHFNAARELWWIEGEPLEALGGEIRSSACYYFGRSAWLYFSTEVDHTETVKASDGVTDSTIYVYKPDEKAYKYYQPEGSDWKLVSQGQVLTLENIGPAHGIGGYVEGDTNGRGNRYAEWAEDDLGGEPSTGVITFGGKTSGEPYTGRIESTKKFAGPFDVVVYAGNGNSAPVDSKPAHEIQISTDGENWTALGSVKFANTRRYYKKTRLHYEGTDEVYVRDAQVSGGSSGQIYDIILLNNGELSKQYTEETAGITNQNAESTILRTEVYSLSGARLNQNAKGVNIIKQVYSNGAVKTRKVVVK